MKMQNRLQNMALHMKQDQWKPKIPGLPLGLGLKLSLAAALWLKLGLPLQLSPGLPLALGLMLGLTLAPVEKTIGNSI